MAKRTRDAQYADRDLSSCIERQFLASTQDAKDLCYEYEQFSAHEVIEDDDSPAAIAPTRAEEEKFEQTIIAQAAAVAATSIADVPTTAQEIIHALLAHKLKRDLEQISSNVSIKELCGGKPAEPSDLRRTPN